MTRISEITNIATERADRHEIEEANLYGGLCKLYSYSRIKNAEISSFIAGAEFADEHRETPWISVKDDLPCNHKELMVKDEKGRWETKRVLVRIQETDTSFKSPYFADCMMSKWDGEESGFLWHLCSQGYITHWMPIPELPEE